MRPCYVGQRLRRSTGYGALVVQPQPVDVENTRRVRGIVQPASRGIERRRTFVRIRDQHLLRSGGAPIDRNPVEVSSAAPRKRQVNPCAVRAPDRLGCLCAVVIVRDAARLPARHIKQVQIGAAVGLPQKSDLRAVRAVSGRCRAQVAGQPLRFLRFRIEPVQVRK